MRRVVLSGEPGVGVCVVGELLELGGKLNELRGRARRIEVILHAILHAHEREPLAMEVVMQLVVGEAQVVGDGVGTRVRPAQPREDVLETLMSRSTGLAGTLEKNAP